MFTGLIEASGTLRRVRPRGPNAELVIEAPAALVAGLSLGESVAVDGACLTVTHAAGALFNVDASAETLARTTLGDRRPGHRVHLERALQLGDRLGGHMVAGHVDGTGRLRARAPLGSSLSLSFEAPPAVRRYLIPKGSVAIDGVSLTVNTVDTEGFSVVLIPHTQGVVHLADAAIGARVNLEADVIGKYVDHLLAQRAGDRPAAPAGQRVDVELLARSGFLA